MTERQKMLADREMLDLWIKFVYEETMNGESRDYRHLDKIIREGFFEKKYLQCGNKYSALWLFILCDGEFGYFDGYKYKKVDANKGNILELSLNVTTKGGKLNILVLNDKEEEIYSNYDLNGNINEKINIDEDGKYMIKIEGDKHEGSYDISWKVE